MDVKEREVVTKTIIPPRIAWIAQWGFKTPQQRTLPNNVRKKKNSMTGGDKRDIADSGFQTGVEKKCITRMI